MLRFVSLGACRFFFFFFYLLCLVAVQIPEDGKEKRFGSVVLVLRVFLFLDG